MKKSAEKDNLLNFNYRFGSQRIDVKIFNVKVDIQTLNIVTPKKIKLLIGANLKFLIALILTSTSTNTNIVF